MKLCVIIPGAGYQQNAGARIRYLRLAEPLRKLGVDLDLVPVSDILRTGLPDSDVFLTSKCFDATTLTVMALAHRGGRLVGVDIFDDYFSHADDSRFLRLRSWLQQALSFSSFILSSTPVMATVGRSFAPGLPVHVLNDPFARLDLAQIRSKLADKRANFHAGAPLQISWFGMGDNPMFPVGLSDLIAYCDDLAPLRGSGTSACVHISTNLRAMNGQLLAALRSLPLPYRLSEWSEEAEADLLERSNAVFLPVNGQRFSVAKSLNRAITALTTGTQVLSSGYPLYSQLDPFIYRDAAALVSDQKNDTARLRPETLDQFQSLLSQVADPAHEAQAIATFLQGLPRPVRSRSGIPGLVVHGGDSSAATHEFARSNGFLSIGTPVSPPKLNYDVLLRWDPTDGEVSTLVHRRNSKLLNERKISFRRTGFLGLGFYLKVEGQLRVRVAGSSLLRSPRQTAILPVYANVMGTSSHLVQALFPDLPLILSEEIRLPWRFPANDFDLPPWKPKR